MSGWVGREGGGGIGSSVCARPLKRIPGAFTGSHERCVWHEPQAVPCASPSKLMHLMTCCTKLHKEGSIISDALA